MNRIQPGLQRLAQPGDALIGGKVAHGVPVASAGPVVAT
jgi:hypothetical protein